MTQKSFKKLQNSCLLSQEYVIYCNYRKVRDPREEKMVFRNEAISDTMNGIVELLESNLERFDHDGETASKETERDLKNILEKFGFKVEFIESIQEN